MTFYVYQKPGYIVRPGELSYIVPSLQNITSKQTLSKEDIQVFSKSGMEWADGGYRGRPFGGVSLICKNNPHILYNEIETLSDRIVAIAVSNANTIIYVLVSVYLPYYKYGDHKQTDLFIETVDALQCIVDQYGSACPVHIMGDLNVQLPRNPTGNIWYKNMVLMNTPESYNILLMVMI